MDINYFMCSVLLVIGLCLGSFAGASVWRLRARQLAEDERDGDLSGHDEYKRLKKIIKKPLLQDHSQCLHCSYQLKWFDLVPLISWLSLGGKCRRCRRSIGYFEPLIEICVALFFVLSFVFWPYPLVDFVNISRFVIWLIAGVGLAILFAYDAKWSLLPDSVNFTVIGLGVVNSIIALFVSSDKVGTLLSIIGAILILSGLYWVLHAMSKGRWIGFGDVKLGLGLALLLADWRLAFLSLFTANLAGCLIVIPGMVIGKIRRNSHIPFGPLLIIGLFIAGIFGSGILHQYLFNIL
jgi:prepilin signal peptidase PulO-like enzyme (type II secretory pathway)